jgi:GDP-D-mannose 3',5'-epimerase
VYQLAADMGGAGYLFTGEHDAEVLHNSALINLNVTHVATKRAVRKLLFTSSVCIYPDYNQLDPESPNCAEDTAYQAQPDIEYGWEKLFGERLHMAYSHNYGTQVRIARLHNVFGPEVTWNGGREKAPAAICERWRKPRTETTSRSEATVIRRARSFMSMSASRDSGD